MNKFEKSYITYNQSTLAGHIKECLSGLDGLNSRNIGLEFVRDPNKDKIILKIDGNWDTVEDFIDSAWEKNR